MSDLAEVREMYLAEVRRADAAEAELAALKPKPCAVGTCLLCETTRHGGDVDAARKAMGGER